MENSELLEIYDREVRFENTWTRMKRENLVNIVRHFNVENPKAGGLVSWSNLSESNADLLIKEQIDFFQLKQCEFEWKYYTHDLPADLPQRLINFGFTADDPEAIMVADINDLPSDYWSMDISAVKPVTSPEGVDAIMQMENQVWGDDLTNLARGMKYDLENNPNHISVYAIWDQGHVVSAAWTFFLIPTSFATLWGGSTLKEYRRHGYYTALLAARAREARRRGFRFLQVDASPDSQPILTSHGFRCLGYSTPYNWKPEN